MLDKKYKWESKEIKIGEQFSVWEKIKIPTPIETGQKKEKNDHFHHFYDDDGTGTDKVPLKVRIPLR